MTVSVEGSAIARDWIAQFAAPSARPNTSWSIVPRETGSQVPTVRASFPSPTPLDATRIKPITTEVCRADATTDLQLNTSVVLLPGRVVARRRLARQSRDHPRDGRN